MNVDSYSFLGLADIAFKNAIDYQPSDSNEQSKLLGKAYAKYLDILKHD